MQIPKDWARELRWMHEFTPSAFIAGGCCRDMLLGKPHKDVDVWILKQDAEQVRLLATDFNWEVVLDRGAYGDFEEVEAVWRHGEYDIVLTTCDSAAAVLNRFDFGISRAMADKAGNIIAAPAFWTDLERRVFKVRHDHGAARSYKRYLRLLEKYPEWTFEDVKPD